MTARNLLILVRLVQSHGIFEKTAHGQAGPKMKAFMDALFAVPAAGSTDSTGLFVKLVFEVPRQRAYGFVSW